MHVSEPFISQCHFPLERSCLTSIKYQHTRAWKRLYLQHRQLPEYQFVKALEKQQEQYWQMGSPTLPLQKPLLWHHLPHKLVFRELMDNDPFQPFRSQKSGYGVFQVWGWCSRKWNFDSYFQEKINFSISATHFSRTLVTFGIFTEGLLCPELLPDPWRSNPRAMLIHNQRLECCPLQRQQVWGWQHHRAITFCFVLPSSHLHSPLFIRSNR